MNSQDSEPMLSVRGFSHRYVRDWAAKDLNLEVNNVGVVGLLGANGAGKSTLMNAICGVLYPTEGDIRIDGISVRQDPESAKRLLGFLPQQAPLHLELTVKEYLTYAASLRLVEKTRIKSVVDEVVEKCGLATHYNRLIGALSGGYRQRCGIAQAVVHNPRFVVLDEPTNGLDPLQVLGVRKLIKDISNNCAILLSTHILREVEAICRKVYMLERGDLVFSGSISEFAHLAAQNSIVVSFRASPNTSKLNQLAGIRNVERLDGKKFRFELSESQLDAQVLIDQLIAESLDFVEVYSERAPLESVFARLSNRSTTGAGRHGAVGDVMASQLEDM